MTDRELLELAAKAYWGEEIDDVCSIRYDESEQCICFIHGDNQDHNGLDREFAWNPLTDDGDALRLSVKTGEPFVVRTRCVTTMGGLMENYDPDTRGDDLRATRRLIVRAAAAIQLAREAKS